MRRCSSRSTATSTAPASACAARSRPPRRRPASRRSPSAGSPPRTRSDVEIDGCRSRPGTRGGGIRSLRRRDRRSRASRRSSTTRACITGPERAEILQLLGVGWLPDPDDLGGRGRRRTAPRRSTTLDSVGPPADEHRSTSSARAPTSGSGCATTCPTRSTSSSTRPPTTCGSTCSARPRSSRGASSNTRVEVPVQARVGNGEVTLDLQLRSRASVAIGERATVEVNVRAEWESVGIVALVDRRRRPAACSASSAPCCGCAATAQAARGARRMPTPVRPRTPTPSRRPPTRSAASERHRARERPDRRGHDRLAPDRVPARRRARLGGRRDAPRRATRSRSPTSCRTTSTRSSRRAC